MFGVGCSIFGLDYTCFLFEVRIVCKYTVCLFAEVPPEANVLKKHGSSFCMSLRVANSIKYSCCYFYRLRKNEKQVYLQGFEPQDSAKKLNFEKICRMQWSACQTDCDTFLSVDRSLARSLACLIVRSVARSLTRYLDRSLNRSLDRSIARWNYFECSNFE